MSEEPKFDLASWATDHGLKRKTTQALSDQDLDTKEMLLKSTESDIAHLNLTIGQARALRSALGALGHRRYEVVEESSDHGGATPSATIPSALNQQVLSTASDDLEALLSGESPASMSQAGGTTAQVPVPGAGGQVRMNPITYGNKAFAAMCDPMMILAVKSDKRKALQIRSFVSDEVRARMNSRRKDKITLGTSEDGRVTLHAEDANSFYVSLDEFGAANMRLAAQLVKNGDLAQADILCYMAYTAMIFDMAGRFDWASVLRFDAKYRELQAEFGFPWGSQHPHTESHMLLPKRAPTQGQPRGPGGNRYSGGNDQLCRQFMARGVCNFGDSCKFRHVEDQRYGAKNGQ